MKSRVASLAIAAVLASGLVLAPTAAMADTVPAGTTTTAPAAGNVATTYGMWFLPCDLGFIKLC
ncbi:hypothetical protein [Arthrobacter sp. GMC3]|uniref:hypothetical protein n=1 Tax=Arthrobacter sp. GMC3 TaxID=2058894 RepID=UPI000CE4A7EE|nr:hypothetical protein [Arthrobacter sp. GMC3]